MSRAFTPRRVSQLEDRIREICGELLDPHVGSGGFDYVQDFGALLPSMVISALIGVPDEDREQVRHHIDQVFHIEPGVGMINDVSFMAQVRLHEYWQGLVDRRRAEPQRRHGHRARRRPRSPTMTARCAASPTRSAATSRTCSSSAGTETVARLLGWAAVMLADNPDQRAELAADASLLPNAVEELLRFEAPSPVQGRWTTEEVELHGTTLPAGSKVLLLTGAAGRDDRKYPDADRFDIHRSFDSHVSLGLRHPLLPRRVARAAREPRRARGDAQALPRVGCRPRSRQAPSHEHRARLRRSPDQGLTSPHSVL